MLLSRAIEVIQAGARLAAAAASQGAAVAADNRTVHHRLPALLLGLVAQLLAAAPASAATELPPLPGSGQVQRPNIVVVMTDDQTLESVRVMENVERLIAAAGVTFESFYTTYSLCCPSRSTFLTGQYPHNHGVLGNYPPNGGYGALDYSNTLPAWLQRAGYNTAHFGKWLNGYGQGGKRKQKEIPAGWSEWYGLVDPKTYLYYGYTVNENGRLKTYRRKPGNYQTDVLTDKAVAVIGRFARQRKPFFLNVAYMAPHATASAGGSPATPAPRHESAFDGVALPSSPSINEADVSDKPAQIRELPLLTAEELEEARQRYESRLEALLAVDEGIARIVSALASAGELGDTVIVFTSDNGYFSGEHRIEEGKVLPYEESIRLPLIVRGPGFPAGAVTGALAANIDLAPTIVELARATARRTQDGRSLVPALEQPATVWARDFLIEAGPDPSSEDESENDRAAQSFLGLRTDRYLYVEYDSGERELYDLVLDPFQLESRHADPAFDAIEADLAARLDAFRDCAGSACA
ncbi:MAG: sulfatase [Thermoleophilia bacterium]|nr:sulfatase [Thermoleophilia bacterium]